MSRESRLKLVGGLEAERGGRLCIAYITSTRQGHEISMADDVLRLLYDHLEANKIKAEMGVDLVIHSNGGQGTVPWRIVSLVREYTKKFAVLVPHRAFSAATLTALGADEILMHRMGCLGPIDPSVSNIFNPPSPMTPGQLAPISVEDVSAYLKLVKHEVGITHEDELIQALLALTEKVHPLALGNVQRHHQQSRLMAGKLLRKHMPAEAKHEMDQIIDHLKSNLFFHGHPISRSEATEDVKLKVITPDPKIEELMWALYLEYEAELQLKVPFNPQHELDAETATTTPTAVTTEMILTQLQKLAQQGLPVGGQVPEAQLVNLAAAMLPHVNGNSAKPLAKRIDGIKGAYLESSSLTNVLMTDLTLERITVATPGGPQPAVRQEVRWQRWETEQ